MWRSCSLGYLLASSSSSYTQHVHVCTSLLLCSLSCSPMSAGKSPTLNYSSSIPFSASSAFHLLLSCWPSGLYVKASQQIRRTSVYTIWGRRGVIGKTKPWSGQYSALCWFGNQRCIYRVNLHNSYSIQKVTLDITDFVQSAWGQEGWVVSPSVSYGTGTTMRRILAPGQKAPSFLVSKHLLLTKCHVHW